MCPITLSGTSFFRRIRTQSGWARAFEISIALTLARGYLDLTALAYSIPSNSRSSTYFPVPLTFFAASGRLKRWSMCSSFGSWGISKFSRKYFPAIRMASSIFLYPVQRQIFPRIAFFTSSALGFGSLSKSPLAQSTMPGMQNPH